MSFSKTVMRANFSTFELVNKNNSAKIKLILDHNPEECSECKFVGEANFGWRTKREFLCCEKYYASINLKLLKLLKKEMTDQMCFHGSVTYRTAAHTMLSNIVYSLDNIWEPYWKHEFYDDDDQEEDSHPMNHVSFVLDILKPIDE